MISAKHISKIVESTGHFRATGNCDYLKERMDAAVALSQEAFEDNYNGLQFLDLIDGILGLRPTISFVEILSIFYMLGYDVQQDAWYEVS